MSPINFPDSPTPGDVFRDFDTGYKYEYDGVVWKSYVDGSAATIKVLDDNSSNFDSFTRTFELLYNGSLYYPISAEHIRVSLDGNLQSPYIDYTVSGAQITFVVPPTPGTEYSVVTTVATAPAPYVESYLQNLDVANRINALTGIVTTLTGNEITYVGLSTFGTLAIGDTVVLTPDFELQNLLSLDSTSAQTIYDALGFSVTQDFANINVTGVSTLGFVTTSDSVVINLNSTSPGLAVSQFGGGFASIFHGVVGINTVNRNLSDTYLTINGAVEVASPFFDGIYSYLSASNLELGIGNTDNPSWIDFHSSPSNINYDARIVKNAGSDSPFYIINRESGGIIFSNIDGGKFEFIDVVTNVLQIKDGNIGINTSNATERLVVIGNSIFSDRVSIGSTLKVLEDAYVKKTLSVGSTDVAGNIPTDRGVISAVGNGKDVIIIQAEDNDLDRGIAFRNKSDRYIGYINAEPLGSTDQADIVFGHAVTNTATVDEVPEIMRLSQNGVGIGTTNVEAKLHVKGNTIFDGELDIKGSLKGVFESVNSATTYLDGSTRVVELDVSQGTTFTYTAGSDSIGIVSFKNIPVEQQNATTITLLHTQGSLTVTGAGNTQNAYPIEQNITINPLGFAGISTIGRTSLNQSIICSSTPDDVDFISFYVHYNGNSATLPESYKVFVTKNGSFR